MYSLARWVEASQLCTSTNKSGKTSVDDENLTDGASLATSAALFLSPLSCRRRALAEAVLSHAQLSIKSASDEKDGASEHDYSSGMFQLKRYVSSSEEEDIVANQVHHCVSRMRKLHSLWETISYTLLTSPLLKEQSQKADLLEAGQATRRLMVPLLQCVAAANEWIFNEHDKLSSKLNFEVTVVRPIEALLLLRPRTLDFSLPSSQAGSTRDLLLQLSRQPLPVVFDSKCPEDNGNIICLLQRVVKSVFQEMGEVATELDMETASCMWPVLHQPLLTQDLHVLMIATLCSSSTSPMPSSEHMLRRLSSLSSLVCLGRLVQILIEPFDASLLVEGGVCGREEAANDEAAGKKRHFAAMRGHEERRNVSGLCDLRALACELVGTDKPRAHEQDVKAEDHLLFEYVRLRWMPFLEFTRHALVLVGESTNVVCGRASLDEDVKISGKDRFIWLLGQVGLGGLVISEDRSSTALVDFSMGLLHDITVAWGNQYAAYYSNISNKSSAMSSSSTRGKITSTVRRWPHLTAREECDSSSEEDEAAEWGSDNDNDSDDDNGGRGNELDGGEEMMGGDDGIDEDLDFQEGMAQLLHAHLSDGIELGFTEVEVDEEGHDEEVEVEVEEGVREMEMEVDIEAPEDTFPPAIVGDGYSDYMYDHDDSSVEEDMRDNQDAAVISYDAWLGGDDSDDEGGAGVRDEMSRWLREMGEALAAGDSLNAISSVC
jgi:hypothetical protein